MPELSEGTAAVFDIFTPNVVACSVEHFRQARIFILKKKKRNRDGSNGLTTLAHDRTCNNHLATHDNVLIITQYLCTCMI